MDTKIPKTDYVQRVNEAKNFLTEKFGSNFFPRVSITLGSGLGKLANLIIPVATIPYKEIPHFPTLTVPGHEGVLIAGYLEGVPVLGFKGRKHYYEVAGQPDAMDQVTFYVQVAASLGIKLFVTTNAAGGLNPSYKVGDLMAIRSHIGFFIPSPLLGPHHDFGGNDFFQPMHDVYTQKYREMFLKISLDIKEGVFAGWTGRTFETVPECLLLRQLGADAVGMSTVPEMVIAHNRKMETLGVSIITNVIAKDGTNATNHEEVMAILNSKETEEKLLGIFREFFVKYQLNNQ